VIRVRRDPYSYLLRVASVAELLMLLEVISFFTESNDLSARFSISGTIFLAMVRRADTLSYTAASLSPVSSVWGMPYSRSSKICSG
jgi:hypothetical protein